MDKLFLDLDDVVAHLHVAIAEYCGISDEHLESTSGIPFNFDHVFRRPPDVFRDFDSSWWASLPPTPWKDSVVDFVLGCVHGGWDDIHVVTALPMEFGSTVVGAAVKGKIDWCAVHLPGLNPTHITFMKHKGMLASEGTGMVDDMQRNVEAFGKNGVLIPSRWNGRWNHFHDFSADPRLYLDREYGYLTV